MTRQPSTKSLRGFDADRSQAVRDSIERASVERRGHGKAVIITPEGVKYSVLPTPRGRFEAEIGFTGMFSSMPIGQYIED